jgi:hypothetical protein
MNLEKTPKEFSILTLEDSPPILPPGDYLVSFVRYNQSPFQGVPKLYVYFSVVDQGPNFEKILFKAYNNYVPPRTGSSLYKDMLLLYGKRIRKNTRLTLDLFKGRILLVRVRTVKRDFKQRLLPEYMHYSVIDSILSVETSNQEGVGTCH